MKSKLNNKISEISSFEGSCKSNEFKDTSNESNYFATDGTDIWKEDVKPLSSKRLTKILHLLKLSKNN